MKWYRRFIAWRKRRALHISAEKLARFNMTAFRGAKKFDDQRWPT